jgi:hypothetical protein
MITQLRQRLQEELQRRNYSFCNHSLVPREVSEKSIVLSWAILKWSVQPDRYEDVSMSGCESIPRSIVHSALPAGV